MTVKVSPKYQVVIPEDVRKSLGIEPGMPVNVLAKGGVAYIVPVRSLEEIQQMFRGKFSPQDLKNIRTKKKDRRL